MPGDSPPGLPGFCSWRNPRKAEALHHLLVTVSLAPVPLAFLTAGTKTASKSNVRKKGPVLACTAGYSSSTGRGTGRVMEERWCLTCKVAGHRVTGWEAGREVDAGVWLISVF